MPADAYEESEILLTTEAFEGEFQRFPIGPMGFDAMALWSSRQFQSVWGTYASATDDATLAALPGEYLDGIAPETLMRYPFLLQAVDSSYWLLHATDQDFLREIEVRIEKVERMPFAPRR